METIAIYWEAKVRTYGFHLVEGLTLCPITLPVDQMGAWGAALHDMADRGAAFRMVWAQLAPDGQIKFYWLCDDSNSETVRTFLRDYPGLDAGHRMGPEQLVDLLFFQGPHFGDRYGIMDFTAKALAQAAMPLMAAVCSVATIYVVVPAGQGAKTKEVLAAAFEIPNKTSDR